jgi:MFS family permease
MKATGRTGSESSAVLLAVCAGSVLTPLMGTMMSLALPHIAADFDAGARSLAMVNTAFLIASVVFMVPAARLASIYGMKRASLAGLAAVIATAVLSAYSPSMEFLLAMRFLMGAGSSVLAVTGIAMLSTVYPLNRRGWAIGVYTAVMYTGFALGPALGGAVSDLAGWRVLFLLTVPVSVISVFFFLRFRGEINPMKGEDSDLRGAVLWMTSILVLMCGVANATDLLGAALIPIGSVMLTVTVFILRRTEHPVLEIDMFRTVMFRRSSLAALLYYASVSSVTFFMALYLQSIGGLTATEAGILMMLQPMVQVLLTTSVGSVSDRMRDRRILPTAGVALTAVGSAMMMSIGTGSSLPYTASVLLIFGLGMALFSAPNTSTIMSSVPDRYQGEASGTVCLVRQAGMMASMGIATVFVSAFMGSMDTLDPSNYGVFLGALHATFAVCLAMCIAAATFSWFRE